MNRPPSPDPSPETKLSRSSTKVSRGIRLLPRGDLGEEPAALGACFAHGQALGPGDAPHLVELGRHRDHAAVQTRDLEGNGAVCRGQRHHLAIEALALIGRPADADGRRLLEEHPREVGHAVRRAESAVNTVPGRLFFIVTGVR